MQYTIIEIKRSNAASRQAIHEIYKYIEGVKTHLGLQQDEIRAIVISTEWDELFLPFSSFVNNSTNDIEGFHLEIDKNGDPLLLTKVTPITLPGGRLLAPWHDLNLYADEISLQKGIDDYHRICTKKGIESYVIVVLSAASDFRENELRFVKSSLIKLNEDWGESDENISDDRLNLLVREHKFILYFANQILSNEVYRTLLLQFSDSADEIPEDLEELSDEDQIYTLHTTLNAIDPRPHYDYYEIGYPSKFSQKLLVDEKWKIESIIREGALKRNTLLSDEQIISELSAHQGITHQIYKKEFRTNDRSQLDLMRKEIQICLEDNETWKTQILRLLDEIAQDFCTSIAKISIYNPNNILLSLHLLYTRKADGELYVPQFFIKVGEEEAPTRIYFGFLEETGGTMPLKQLIERYYGGNSAMALLSLTWGGYESNDYHIVHDIGLKYMTARIDMLEKRVERKLLKEMCWVSAERLYRPEDYLYGYIKANQEFMNDLNRLYRDRAGGGLVDLSSL